MEKMVINAVTESFVTAAGTIRLRKVFLNDINAAIALYKTGSEPDIGLDFGIPVYIAEMNGEKVATLSLCVDDLDQNQIVPVIRAYEGFEDSFERMTEMMNSQNPPDLAKLFGFENENGFRRALYQLVNWLNS
ncbi:hypothetical protein [Desertivirga xinjiangensis]|uniref:hypothetical protein n=1 Tax=Desertivirga xinjiangensis TaxID=539206 RepID=UPI002109CC86|nr:hypothetical protein [Pedobacter xinjiangensis]